MPLPERYSLAPFPAYRYIPGRFPHPSRDPDGHSYGRDDTRLDAFDPDNWQRCEPYLYGVDLYNHGYWWEAHEAWETCWKAAGKTTKTGLFIQGLIQIAAGCLKQHQGHVAAARGLAAEGLKKFPRPAQCLLGIDTAAFGAATRRYFSGAQDKPPVIRLRIS